MIYVLTFTAGFVLGYLVESFIEMITDRILDDNEGEHSDD